MTETRRRELRHRRATPGAAPDEFEVAVEAGARSGPDVEGEVVETLAVERGSVLERTALSFAVPAAERPDGVAESDLRFYAYGDGEWRETAVDRSEGSFDATLTSASALAVVAPAADGDEEPAATGTTTAPTATRSRPTATGTTAAPTATASGSPD